MTLFGWLDIALAGVAVVLFVVWAALVVAGLFRRRPGRRETMVRWPRWLPHRHEWREYRGWFSLDEQEWHEACVRCYRRRNSRVVPR